MAIIMILALLLTGGNDLASVIDAEYFWTIKRIRVTEQNMQRYLRLSNKDEIDQLIKGLKSDDVAVKKRTIMQAAQYCYSIKVMLSYRTNLQKVTIKGRYMEQKIRVGIIKGQKLMQLMAIKCLGEMKSRKSLPELKKLQISDDPFVKIYARNAIEKITGLKQVQEKVDNKKIPWLITDNTILAGQLKNNFPFSFQRLNRKNDTCYTGIRQFKTMLQNQLLQLVENTGNIKIESLGFTVDEYSDYKLGATLVVKGVFPRNLFSLQKTIQVGEYKIYSLDKQMKVLMKDNIVVFRYNEKLKNDPYSVPQKLIRSFKVGHKVLTSDPILSPYLKKINLNSNAWIAGMVPQKFNKDPFKDAPIQSLYGNMTINNNIINGHLVLTGGKASIVKIVDQVNRKNEWAKKQLASVKDNPCMSYVKSMKRILDSYTIKNKGTYCDVSVTIKKADALFVDILLGISSYSHGTLIH